MPSFAAWSRSRTSGEVTIFVYNAGGTLVAEYSTVLATTQQVSYLTQDHLGSPRVITNENGTVKDRKDYSAFGEESTSSQRSSNSEYTAADQLRKNYTGYEKDSESGLEFAQARYYNPTHGRFTSVDPMTGSASIRNPQTFNRYSYVLNSPYKFSDPLGLIPETTGACGTRCPNSGGYVDGSGFRGRDATFDWLTPEITLPIIAMSQTSSGRGPITAADRKVLQKSLRKLVPGTRVTQNGQIIIPRVGQNTAGYRLISGIGNTGYSLTIVVNNQGINEAMTPSEDRMRKTRPFWTDIAVKLGRPSDMIAFWDPNTAGTEEVRVNANRIQSVSANPTSVLAHELIHAYDSMRGIDRSNTTPFLNSSIDFKHYFTEGAVSYYESASYEEFKTVGFLGTQAGDVSENQIRAQLGLPRLAAYSQRKSWVKAN